MFALSQVTDGGVHLINGTVHGKTGDRPAHAFVCGSAAPRRPCCARWQLGASIDSTCAVRRVLQPRDHASMKAARVALEG